MNAKFRARKPVVKAAAKKIISTREAAARLNLSQRQVEDIVARFRRKGDAVFTHGNAGRTPANALSEKDRATIRGFWTESVCDGENIFVKTRATYQNFNEHLFARTGLKISTPTAKKYIRQMFGYRSPYKRRGALKTLHPPRPRRECFGELVQIDASPFKIMPFGRRGGENLALHLAVDDATGKILGAYICKNECDLGYFEVIRRMGSRFGLPKQCLGDGVIAKRVEKDESKWSVEEQLKGMADNKLTQLGAVMGELGVEVLLARSPQSKGRVERANRTIQNRIATDLAMEGAKTVGDANAALEKLVERYNRKFAVPPKRRENLFCPVSACELARILRFRIPRKASATGVISVLNHKFFSPDLRGQKVNFCMSERDGVWLEKPRDHSCRRYEARLLEEGAKSYMPQVWQDLIDRFFFSDLKKNWHEIVLSPDDLSCGFG